MSIAPTRPLLRYPGGKWRLAPHIIRHMPPHRVYTEPYGGAGSVWLRKPPAEVEVWNDSFSELYTLFQVLRNRNQYRELKRALRLTPYSREEWQLAFIPTDEPVEQARRLVVRSWMSIGSDAATLKRRAGFRRDIRIDISGTIAAQQWRGYIDALDQIVDRVTHNTIVECTDAQQFLRAYDFADVLHYVDPPYPHSTRRELRFYENEMSDDEHIELLETLRSLDGMVLLSSYPNALYDDALSNWHYVDCAARASGGRGGVAKQRNDRRTERLYINPAAHAALHHQLELAI